MSATNSSKRYPASTAEVAKMLGLPTANEDLPMGSFVSHGDLPVANLPIQQPEAATVAKDSEHHNQPANPGLNHAVATDVPPLQTKPEQPAYIKFSKQLLPYAAIFTIGIFLYYFFFSSLNLNLNLNVADMFGGKSSQVEAAPQESAIALLEQQDMAGYESWIHGFYYDINDPKVIDPNTDNSGNGLTNFQKYLLNLNPKSYDTLGLGTADSQDLAEGISPTTGAPLTASQSSIIAKYIDMEAVNNRLALYSMQNPSRVAGAATTGIIANPNNFNSQAVPGDAAVVAPSNSYSQNNQSQTANNVAGTPTDNSVSINTAVPGTLSIPNLKINVPIIWSKDPTDFENDLQSGVVHYPGTAMPGAIGTTYIAGHSSNYSWAKGKYNQIFSTLGKLTKDASFSITVTTTSGKQATYNYVMVNSGQYSPTDQAQFANTGQSLVALSTCWPVGSTSKRLVVFGQLVSVDK
ncbi:MAG: sortase [Candidatus Doudnabacteria bacterium]|nr:sortase [Candidatus Doudnabacteria bacterium]